MPLQDMFKGTDHRMVRFNDLWFLFQLGEVLYVPVSANDAFTSDPNRGMYQTAFLLYHKTISKIADTNPSDFKFNKRTMRLWCYYIDYNGDSYGPVTQKFVIEAFDGEEDISDLVAYPIRFAEKAEKLRVDLKKQGGQFRFFSKEKHVYCEGWTVTHSPLGTSGRRDRRIPEHIDSDVIIDFGEALKKHPSWKPEFSALTSNDEDGGWLSGKDIMSICHWPDRARKGKPWFSLTEKTQRDDAMGGRMRNEKLETNTFIKAFYNGKTQQLDGLDEDTNDLLLPRRFFAYVLRERRFVMVDVLSLKKIPPQPTIFDDLRIDENHKLMVKSLVAAHFEKRRIQRLRPTIGATNQDLIRGKGSGMFILLHGVPGVGKTATAEAVAQANDKPLFTISCGDLGITPKEVEDRLTSIFRLAHLWDCVLLLDEADVFLARRDIFNLKRNALVSGTYTIPHAPFQLVGCLTSLSVPPSSRLLQRDSFRHDQQGRNARRGLQVPDPRQPLLRAAVEGSDHRDLPS
jgi:hypothetical protein